jgi:ribosome recycling factor
MNEQPVIDEMSARMAKALDHTLHEFSSIHTGKAHPSMVENVMIEVYGSNMRLKEVAAITTPDSRLIQVQPWDKSTLKAVEKGLQVANIGINPAIDGSIIRLPLPELSRERRQELVKVAHRMAEEGRVAVRHVRRDTLEAIKKLQKEGQISEDDQKRLEKEVQNQTDKIIKEIGEHLAHKEQELLAI